MRKMVCGLIVLAFIAFVQPFTVSGDQTPEITIQEESENCNFIESLFNDDLVCPINEPLIKEPVERCWVIGHCLCCAGGSCQCADPPEL